MSPELTEAERAVVDRFEAGEAAPESWGVRVHGLEDDCPRCYECPGCGGGSGATPENWRLDRTTYPGVVMLICEDCDGTGYRCDYAITEATS